MMIRNRISAGIFAGLISCVCLLPAYSASATSVNEDSSSVEGESSALSTDDLRIAQQRLQAAGVDASVQDDLLRKIADGQLLDSTTGQHELRSFDGVINGERARITEYADGSRRWETIGSPSGSNSSDADAIRPLAAINDCEDAPGAGTFWHYNCRVSSEDAVSTAGFVVDYKTSQVGSLPAEVRDPRGAYCSLAGGSCTVTGAVVDRAAAEGTAPARASMSFTGTITQNAASIAGSVWIDVVGISATANKTPVS